MLRGDIVVDGLHVDTPKVRLTKNESGEANWQFSAQKEQEEAPPTERRELPIVRDLTIKDADLDYKDKQSGNNVSLTLSDFAASSQAEGVQAKGKGTYQRQPLSLDVKAGSLEALRSEGQAYPVDINIASSAFSAKVEGTISEPQKLEGLDLRVAVKGNNLADLYTLAGVPVPPSPPYSLKGHLTREGSGFKLADFDGRLGGSDLSGTAAVDTGNKRLKATADLVSRKFDFDDIAVGAGGKRKEEKQAEAKKEAQGQPTDPTVLPDKPIDLSKLREMDAAVRLKAGQVLIPGVPIDGLNADVTLEKGILQLKPVAVKIGDGTVDLFMTLDGSAQPAHSDIDARISHVDLKRLLSKSPFAQESAGRFGGRVKLVATGNSVADILGSVTGTLFAVMSGGKISHLLIELAGLDIAESLGVAVSGDEPIPIRCVIGDFKADNGLFAVKTMVFDTTDTNIVGEGRDQHARGEAGSEVDAISQGLQPVDPAQPDLDPGDLQEPAGVSGPGRARRRRDHQEGHQRHPHPDRRPGAADRRGRRQGQRRRRPHRRGEADDQGLKAARLAGRGGGHRSGGMLGRGANFRWGAVRRRRHPACHLPTARTECQLAKS